MGIACDKTYIAILERRILEEDTVPYDRDMALCIRLHPIVTVRDIVLWRRRFPENVATGVKAMLLLKQ